MSYIIEESYQYAHLCELITSGYYYFQSKERFVIEKGDQKVIITFDVIGNNEEFYGKNHNVEVFNIDTNIEEKDELKSYYFEFVRDGLLLVKNKYNIRLLENSKLSPDDPEGIREIIFNK